MTGSSSAGGATAALVQAVAVCTVTVLPTFLLGAMAVQVREDLAVGPAQIGFAAATLFGVTGLVARPLSRVVQRIGSDRGIITAALLATVSLIGMAVAPSFAVVIVALVIAGLANAMAQPAANLSISRAIGSRRLGLAFGIKQSSIPGAALLGGLAVPGVALVLGWRWAFVIGAILAASLAIWAVAAVSTTARRARAAAPPSKVEESEADRGTPFGGLVMLAIGAGLAAAAATAMGVFLVDSAVSFGIAPSTAGLLAAGAALLGLVLRVLLGAAVDRHPKRSPYVLIANLLTGGTVGYILLSLGAQPFFVVGALLAYAAGWTWTGLVHFAVVRDNRLAAASATGVLQTGLSLGAATGPLLFGLVVETSSYNVAWVSAAVVALLAAITFRAARRMIRRKRGLPVRIIRSRKGRNVETEQI